jgi:hypothetical protein
MGFFERGVEIGEVQWAAFDRDKVVRLPPEIPYTSTDVPLNDGVPRFVAICPLHPTWDCRAYRWVHQFSDSPQRLDDGARFRVALSPNGRRLPLTSPTSSEKGAFCRDSIGGWRNDL